MDPDAAIEYANELRDALTDMVTGHPDARRNEFKLAAVKVLTQASAAIFASLSGLPYSGRWIDETSERMVGMLMEMHPAAVCCN